MNPEQIEIDEKYSGWLQEHGFSRGPEGSAYVKHVELNGDSVKLQVDFSKQPWGARYGYRLNKTVDPPDWKSETSLRDHPELLEYKAFRDKTVDEASKGKSGKPHEPEKPAELPPMMPDSDVVSSKNGQALMLDLRAKDEIQIITEMRGELQADCLKEYFYSFKQGDRTVTGLSYAGVRAVARKQEHIIVKDLVYNETPKAWIVTCKGVDKARDFEVYGVSMQPKNQRFRSGGSAPDEFALNKAIAKAQRNALKCLIPEKVVARMYAEYVKNRDEIEELKRKTREALR